MSKDIKDYLHLYLGCKVKIIEIPSSLAEGELSGQEWAKVGEIVPLTPYLLWLICFDHDFNYMLILRGLSSITESELSECETIGGTEYINDVFRFVHYGSETKYLLSKHFDLFGLIDAGLAINKTTFQ